MLEINECELSDIIHLSSENCDYSLLTEYLCITYDNDLVGCAGFSRINQDGADRIFSLAMTIEETYRDLGFYRGAAELIRDKFISESPNGKIWVLNKLLAEEALHIAPDFGFKPLNLLDYYLMHNTDDDAEATQFAIDVINIIHETDDTIEGV